MSKSTIYKVPTERLNELISSSSSLTEILRKLEMAISNKSLEILRKRLLIENFDCSQLIARRKEIQQKNIIQHPIPLEKILVKNSIYGTSKLRRRLIKEGILENKCVLCGQEPFHNGSPLTLILDHINGINNDHRLSNLRILCPNCHSQTDTFGGKNTAKARTRKRCVDCQCIVDRRVTRCKSCYRKTLNPKPTEPKSPRIIKVRKNNSCKGCSKTISGYATLCKSCAATEFNKRNQKAERPSKEQLTELILNYPFTTIAKQYGVSDNAIRKWCKHYGLPFKQDEIAKLRG